MQTTLKDGPSMMSIPGGSRLPCYYQCTIQLLHSDLNNVDEGADLIQCRYTFFDILALTYRTNTVPLPVHPLSL